MEAHSLQKFCPVCKLANDADATICRHCKAPLNEGTLGPPTTRHVEKPFELTEELKEKITRSYPPPPSGILFFLLNKSEPIALCTEQEFVLGRGISLTAKPQLDLSGFNAYDMGVSRSHALINVVEGKYLLTDLHSANGTWINGDRIVPAKPYDLPSKSVIQLGRLKLVVLYSQPAGSEKE